jgi:hypothetical protein
MEYLRNRRFNKETKNISYDIVANPTFEDMQVMPNVFITLPKNYPFQPPILKINDKKYVDHFLTLYTKYKLYIELYQIPIRCICCKSVICDWTPCLGMKEVIQDCISYGKKMAIISKSKWVLDKLIFDNLVCSIILQYLI